MSGRASLKRPGSPAKRNSASKKELDLKHALSSAKMTFETSLKRSRSSTANAALTPPAAVGDVTGTDHKKSSSAPVSPVKAADSVSTRRRHPDLSPRGRKRHQTDDAAESQTVTTSCSSSSTTSSISATAAPVGLLTEASSKLQRRPKATAMDEVMKLHQDEGVMHLLHSLPTSRRKVQTNLFNASPNSLGKRPAMSHLNVRTRSPAPQQKASDGHKKMRETVAKNNLIRVNPGDVEPMTAEMLMNPKTLERLKKLPKKDYVYLWSSTSRYKLSDEAVSGCTTLQMQQQQAASASSVSPNSSTESDISSASGQMRLPRRAQIGSRMLLCVSNVTKQYKDLHIRTYPTFAQIILNPTTTGMRHSFNVAVIEEILDALKVLREDVNVRAVMITGLGGVFSQGVDLTMLTFDSVEKQKKSAEALAAAIRRLVFALVDYEKLLVGGVNGDANGLGVCLLPLFDLVYANDKARFRTEYAKIGQIPEAFASVTTAASGIQHGLGEMFYLGRSLTAAEAQCKGLVSAVVWPDRFLEEIVPRMELLESGSEMRGMGVMKKALKARLRRQLVEAAEEETRTLVKCWTEPKFAKQTKEYLKSCDNIIFQ